MTADPADRAAARSWLADHATLTLDDLLAAVVAIYGDGALIGTASAAQTLGASLADLLPGAPPGAVDWSAFWDAWTPGDPDAAALLNSGGLADLLGDAEVTIRGITGTTLDRLGNALADGAASGESADAIAASLAELIGDPARAYRIAVTELARAVSQASLDSYGRDGVARYDLVTSPGACVLCLDAAADGPYAVDDPEGRAPIHPTCRCAVSPAAG